MMLIDSKFYGEPIKATPEVKQSFYNLFPNEWKEGFTLDECMAMVLRKSEITHMASNRCKEGAKYLTQYKNIGLAFFQSSKGDLVIIGVKEMIPLADIQMTSVDKKIRKAQQKFLRKMVGNG